MMPDLSDPSVVAWVIIAISAVAVVVGALKIISNGITMVLWLLLAIGGVLGVDYGLKAGDGVAAKALPASVQTVLGQGGTLSKQALEALCRQVAEQP
ncbi:hypothetical protein Mmc1_3699 [Magnetococcus marinus MC-1]|uniref:Uncharacterized protein n=1 Tax=Magnetococcus marinus (strain ATCC BAA-1437 / JCM 17883 / MC-1) TaxID=156889 RepID=A0LDZ1_MAGMM|nr:hypothetical protein [Magnetococcus marinus]ABK46184.1 hypothetical protein Mmc1_3699 [Magnetococcus marinus MC-1]